MNYYKNYILIDFVNEDGYERLIYLTPNLVINSRKGEYSETELYSLTTKTSTHVIYEVAGINGTEADIVFNGHDSANNRLAPKTGKLNLQTLETKWDDANN